MEKIVRNKRKCVTIIKGLDMFGKCRIVVLFIWIHLEFDFLSLIFSDHFLQMFYKSNCWMQYIIAKVDFIAIAGIKLSEASKKLGKKFASGASVVKVSIIIPITADNWR